MRPSIALLTGYMNPFTIGHKHVVDTSLLVFDRVVVGIGINPQKSESSELFSREQRIKMAQDCLTEHGDRVQVEFFSGAAVDFAQTISAAAIVRGIRNDMDQSYESSMSHANSLISKLELGRIIPTFYVPCPPSLAEVSSSRVRELIQLRRSIDVLREYVLPPVAEVIEQELYKG